MSGRCTQPGTPDRAPVPERIQVPIAGDRVSTRYQLDLTAETGQIVDTAGDLPLHIGEPMPAAEALKHATELELASRAATALALLALTNPAAQQAERAAEHLHRRLLDDLTDHHTPPATSRKDHDR